MYCMGLFDEPVEKISPLHVLRQYASYKLHRALLKARGLPCDFYSTACYPDTIKKIARRYNLKSEWFNCANYQYRYHPKLSRNGTEQ
jgi:hypothetical protein